MFHEFNTCSFKNNYVFIVVATTESTKLLGKFMSLNYINCRQFTTINIGIFISIHASNQHYNIIMLDREADQQRALSLIHC